MFTMGTGTSPAALGFRVHSGWTAVTVVAGPRAAPRVLDRRKVELVTTFTYRYRQPYHTAAEMTPKEAAAFIPRCQIEARRLAGVALRTLQRDLNEKGHKIAVCGLLLSSARPLPGLSEILTSHAVIHTADGELFRNAIVDACKSWRLPVRPIKERELPACLAKEMELDGEAVKRLTADLGRGIGPPWRQDEKLAALAACLALYHS